MKTYNAAVIGAAGWIGGLHSDCWIRAASMLPEGVKVNLHTAVDVNEEGVKKVAERYGYDAWTTSYDEAIANPEIDIIDVCCGNHLHKDVIVKAAAAGKLIMCEKPISISMQDAEDILAAVKKYNTKCRMCFMYRKYPSITYIKQMIDNGDLGELNHLRIAFEQDFYCDPQEPYTWRFSQATSGGGSIVSLGAHILDLARYLMGDVDSLVAQWNTMIYKRPVARGSDEYKPVDVDDLAMAMVNFKSGATGIVYSNWMIHGHKHHMEFELSGSKGTVRFNSERLNEFEFCDGTSDPLKRGFTTILVGADHPYGEFFSQKTGMGIGIKEAFTLQITDFIRDLQEWKGRGATFEDGYENLKFIKKIQESNEKKGWVKF